MLQSSFKQPQVHVLEHYPLQCNSLSFCSCPTCSSHSKDNVDNDLLLFQCDLFFNFTLDFSHLGAWSCLKFSHGNIYNVVLWNCSQKSKWNTFSGWSNSLCWLPEWPRFRWICKLKPASSTKTYFFETSKSGVCCPTLQPLIYKEQ